MRFLYYIENIAEAQIMRIQPSNDQIMEAMNFKNRLHTWLTLSKRSHGVYFFADAYKIFLRQLCAHCGKILTIPTHMTSLLANYLHKTYQTAHEM